MINTNFFTEMSFTHTNRKKGERIIQKKREQKTMMYKNNTFLFKLIMNALQSWFQKDWFVARSLEKHLNYIDFF